jgi:TM2 domain-containing membrane protein YozV
MANSSGIDAIVLCRQCDSRILAIAEICPHCGVRQHGGELDQPHDVSDKRLVPAAILCILLGVFGAHRFYTGKTLTGLAQLVTLGGLGLWMLYDLVLILTGQFRDSYEKRIIEPL